MRTVEEMAWSVTIRLDQVEDHTAFGRLRFREGVAPYK
jgi:hypothetical protein